MYLSDWSGLPDHIRVMLFVDDITPLTCRATFRKDRAAIRNWIRLKCLKIHTGKTEAVGHTEPEHRKKVYYGDRVDDFIAVTNRTRLLGGCLHTSGSHLECKRIQSSLHTMRNRIRRINSIHNASLVRKAALATRYVTPILAHYATSKCWTDYRDLGRKSIDYQLTTLGDNLIPGKEELVKYHPDLRVQGYAAHRLGLSWLHPSHIRDKSLQRVALKRAIPHLKDGTMTVDSSTIKPRSDSFIVQLYRSVEAKLASIDPVFKPSWPQTQITTPWGRPSTSAIDLECGDIIHVVRSMRRVSAKKFGNCQGCLQSKVARKLTIEHLLTCQSVNDPVTTQDLLQPHEDATPRRNLEKRLAALSKA